MKNGNLIESFINAFNGIKNTFRNERNFKIHVFAAVLVICASFCFKLDSLSIAAVFVAVGGVLTAELINTSVEALVDLYCGDMPNPLARIAKDTAAGAVLVSSVFAVIIGFIVFGRKIIDIIILL